MITGFYFQKGEINMRDKVISFLESPIKRKDAVVIGGVGMLISIISIIPIMSMFKPDKKKKVIE